MRRLLTLAFVLLAVPAFAQVTSNDLTKGVTPPIFGNPSAVNGGGTVTSPQLLLPDGTSSAPALSFITQPGMGLYRSGTNALTYAVSGTAYAQFNGPSFTLLSDTGALNFGVSADTILTREAANHLFQRSTTNAQRASWANTYTGATNYEAFSIDWQTLANTAIVGTRTAATGTGRAVRFVSQDTNAANSYATLLLTTQSLPFARSGLLTSTLTNVTTSTAGTFFSMGEITSSATSGSVVNTAILPTYNQASGNAANTDLQIARTETAVGSGTQYFINMLGGAAGATQRAAIDSTGKFTAYTSVATAGQGVDVVRAQATTGSVVNSGTASIATWTPGAADVEVEIGCRVNITVSTNHTFSCDVTYTDVSNAARVRVLPMYPITGTVLTSGLMTNAIGAGDYGSATIRIGVKASTAIVVRTSSGGTYTTVTYTASGTIKQVG